MQPSLAVTRRLSLLCVVTGSHLYLHKFKVGQHGQFDLIKLNAYLINRVNRLTDCLDEHESVDRDTGDRQIESQEDFISVKNDENDSEVELKSALKRGKLPSLPNPQQLITRKGDLILLHPDLAHTGAPNIMSEEIRRMVYFRVRVATSSTTTTTMTGCDNTSSVDSDASDVNTDKKCYPSNIHCLNWSDIVALHRQNMWIDLQGVEKYRLRLKSIAKSL